MGFLDWIFRPPGREKFAGMVSKLLREAGETRSITYDPVDFRLIMSGGDNNSFYLHNMYNEYLRASRRERKALLVRYASFSQQVRQQEPTAAEARQSLLPRVRERFYHESVRLVARSQG